MIAYCGLKCDSCTIHLATITKDKYIQQTMRITIAEECSQIYGINLQPEDINDCDGCKADTKRLFNSCMNCEIRKCATDKKIENCAYCNAFACEKLKEHFLLDPGSQARLTEIRQNARI